MSIEGFWTIEFYGVFGWESAGVLVFEAGRARGGGNNHITTGSYTGEGEAVSVDLTCNYFGTPRTMFGEELRVFPIRLIGKHVDDVISGEASRPDKADLPLQFRLVRRAELV